MMKELTDAEFASRRVSCAAPPIINVESTTALTQTVGTGDDITVTAILRASPEQTSQTRKRSANLLPTGAHKIYLEAVTVFQHCQKEKLH
jgi:hypothetical protein